MALDDVSPEAVDVVQVAHTFVDECSDAYASTRLDDGTLEAWISNLQAELAGADRVTLESVAIDAISKLADARENRPRPIRPCMRRRR